MKTAWITKWALALGLCLGSSATFAQQDAPIQFGEQKADLTCMQPAAAQRGVPVYPPNAWEEQLSATVRVKLTFSAADAEPSVELLDKDIAEFGEAVKRYVRRYRLPCFKFGQAPIEVTQRFDFRYGDGRKVTYSSPEDGARSAYEGCVAYAKPVYPAVVAQSGVGGTVILSMTFSRRGAPPDVKVVYGGDRKSTRLNSSHVD